MTRAKLALICAVILGGSLVAATVPAGAQAVPAGAVYSARAAYQAKVAHRAAVRAERRAEVARYVARQTVAVTARYGSSVGRWVSLASRVGWPRAQWGQLFYVINRESRGQPAVVNSVIGCTGLLQIWPGNVTEPGRLTDAKYNLSQGLKLYRAAGWSPWAL